MAQKTIINIETLNIHIGNRSGSGLPSFLEAIFSGPIRHCNEEGTGGEATTGAGTNTEAGSTGGTASVSQATATTVVTADRVLDYLNSDDRYTLRTLSAIQKHFADSDPTDVAGVVSTLVDAGSVVTKRRRSDGATLYKAAVFTTNAATQPADSSTDLTRENVQAFLRSDARYSQRTEASIFKHFADHDSDDVARLLDDMVDDDELETKTRRRDGATLYSIA